MQKGPFIFTTLKDERRLFSPAEKANIDTRVFRRNNWRMSRKARKYLWGLCVWATTASTLLAAFPHVSCRCPNGQVKPFCFRSLLSQNGCCSGPCCQDKEDSTGPSSGTPQSKKKCCCKQTRTEPSAPTGPPVLSQNEREKGTPKALVFGKPGCQKSVIQPEPSSLSRAESTAELGHLWLTFFIIPAPETSAPRTLHLTAFFGLHRVPPPTDLVTLLQHFTI